MKHLILPSTLATLGGLIGALTATLTVFACSENFKDSVQTPEGTAPGPVSTADSGSNAHETDSGPRADPSPSDNGDSGDNGDAPHLVSGDTAAVQFVGRFDTREDAGPKCGWPGCRVVARFDGTTQVSVRLEEIEASWMAGGPSEWDVLVDGQLQPKLVLTPGVADYLLADCLTPDEHTIEIYKRSEAQNGVTRFMGYDFHGGELLPLPASAHVVRRLEMIGDSQVAALGVDGASIGPNCPPPQWAAHYQNFHESFGALMGERFGAEVFGTAYSGKGMVRNITTGDTDTMPTLFLRANPVDPSSTWDWSWTPDVVVVQIGGNDFSVQIPVDDGPPTLAEFTSVYRDFVSTLRSHYPQAFLLLVLSASTPEIIPPGRPARQNIWTTLEQIVSEHTSSGDEAIADYAPPVATDDERRGCDGHGTPEYHVRIAQQIGDVIAAKVGWR
ncbi:MAG: GDSL-type esterase/lipase family protein [Polyangiaceae bacterium]|nr:GDSL-type esterase/lipase family protein [Polyangiaceae bacterium]